MRVSMAVLQCGASGYSVLQRVAVCVYGVPLVWHCRDHLYCEAERVDTRRLQQACCSVVQCCSVCCSVCSVLQCASI